MQDTSAPSRRALASRLTNNAGPFPPMTRSGRSTRLTGPSSASRRRRRERPPRDRRYRAHRRGRSPVDADRLRRRLDLGGGPRDKRDRPPSLACINAIAADAAPWAIDGDFTGKFHRWPPCSEERSRAFNMGSKASASWSGAASGESLSRGVSASGQTSRRIRGPSGVA